MSAKFGIGGVLLSVLFLTAAPALAAGRGGGGGGGSGGQMGGGGGGRMGGGGGAHPAISGGGMSSGGGGHMGGGGGAQPAISGGGMSSGGTFHSGGQMHQGTLQPFSGRGENWSGRGENWNQGAWNRGGEWGHGEFGRHDFDDWGRFGVSRPWGWGWGNWGWGDYGYPYAYGYYGWPSYNYYTYDATPYYYGSDVYSSQGQQPYTAAYSSSESGMSDFYGQAVSAFRRGDYRTAMRFAGHAAVDNPRDPNVHLLMTLCLFALADYRGAAMEAHGLAAMGNIPDWPTVFRFYGNVQPYTDQLRALEKFAHDHPSAPEGRFLLGFQYLTTGHKENAQEEFLAALKATPQDRLAGQLLTKVGGTIPEDIAKQQAQHPLQESTSVSEEARKNIIVPGEGSKNIPITPESLTPAPSAPSEQGTPSGEHLY